MLSLSQGATPLVLPSKATYISLYEEPGMARIIGAKQGSHIFIYDYLTQTEIFKESTLYKANTILLSKDYFTFQ